MAQGMNPLAHDIDRALAAHDRQPAGRVVSALRPNADADDVTAGETMAVRYGPDKGRRCVCVGWCVQGRSVRVRFPEREAVVPRDWVVGV